jgi:putative SOS response-associated peptidase YedK
VNALTRLRQRGARNGSRSRAALVAAEQARSSEIDPLVVAPSEKRAGGLSLSRSVGPERNAEDGERELTMARWGMPSPVFALKGRNSDSGGTNIRDVASPHWRRWLGVESRCVVPFTSFAENELQPDGSRPPVWFALDESRPLAFFAGVWTRWTSVRKVKEGETTNDLFAFLTTEANAVVAPIHAKAMPVILTTPEEVDLWMTAPAKVALTLQRPLPDDALRIVARGQKQDTKACLTYLRLSAFAVDPYQDTDVAVGDAPQRWSSPRASPSDQKTSR